MKVAVVGLWHLGTVTAACLASAGHDVTGFDGDEATVRGLREGKPPVFEPGLAELVTAGVGDGKLSFTQDGAEAVAGADVVWVTYDTPVDEDDNADVEFVVRQVEVLLEHVRDDAVVLVSSQVPVGTTRRLERSPANAKGTQRRREFAYSPENLRLGKAIDVFTKPDRVVVGANEGWVRSRIEDLLRPITTRIEWMSVESAEMSKHAINAFLANSVSFINELAEICEEVRADAKEVERALKTESRIGPRAYLSPGAAFAGGTLARDVRFLAHLGATHGRPTHLVSAIKTSNDAHRMWAARKLERLLGDLQRASVAIWGLTYKPGTDTLRRSSAVELADWLAKHGVAVRAHDPAVRSLPPDLAAKIRVFDSAIEALVGANALVIATEWPEYRGVAPATVIAAMASPIVLDAGSFLKATLGSDKMVQYVTVGRSS